MAQRSVVHPASRSGRVPLRALARRRRRARRAVSDVVATILLLALTVTLFAAIFAFVTTFPAPAPQNSNQFQAALQYGSGGSKIIGVNITHLAGPIVPGNAQIYLKSAGHPSDCPFTTPIYVSAGIATTFWSLGQVWRGPFTSFPGCGSYTGDPVPDNITVYVVSQGNLLYSVVLPGQVLNSPPTITSAWTAPSSVVHGAGFRVYASISGNLGTHKAYLNLAGVPGQSSSTLAMWYNSTLAVWQFNVSSTSSTSAGTYYGIVNVTGISGQTATAAVTITVTASSSSFPTLSVTPSIQPSTAFLRNPENVYATITNSGPNAATTTSVTFWVNYTSNSTNAKTITVVTSQVVNAYSSLTIAGSSTWLPLAATNYNLTARVLFSSGTSTVGWVLFAAGQPFSASVVASPPSVAASGTSTMVITLSNFGPLAGTTANVTIFVNKTSTTSGQGNFTVHPAQGKGWATPSAGSALGAYSTLTLTLLWTAPAHAVTTDTVTIYVVLTNGSWTTSYALTATTTVSG